MASDTGQNLPNNQSLVKTFTEPILNRGRLKIGGSGRGNNVVDLRF